MKEALANIKKRLFPGTTDNTPPYSTGNVTIVANLISAALSVILLNLLFVLFPELAPAQVFNYAAIFLACAAPMVMNYFKFKTAARWWLSVTLPCILVWLGITTEKEFAISRSNLQEELHLYLLAASCVPHLLLRKRNVLYLITGLLPTLLCFVFLTNILTAFDLEIPARPGASTLRFLIPFITINAVCFLFNTYLARNAQLNKKLVKELLDKNKVIKEHAEGEIDQLYDQLKLNLEQLSAREFILKESQRIAKIGSWEHYPRTNYLYWSDEMYNIFGLDKRFDLTAPDLNKIMWGDQSGIIDQAEEELLRTGRSYDLTLQNKTPFGYMKWVRINAYPIYEGSKVVGARGIMHDVTHYKEAEELIRRSENNYRTLFEQASDFIIVIDNDGRFIDVNQSFCQTFNYTKAEALSMNIESMVDEQDKAEKPLRYKEVMYGDLIVSDRKMVSRDGNIVEVEAIVKRIPDNLILILARDTTERKKNQRKLELSQANLNATINNTEILIWSVDRNFRLLSFNKPFREYMNQRFGLAVKEGEKIYDRETAKKYSETNERWKRSYLRALAGEMVTLEEGQFDRFFQLSLGPIVVGSEIIGVSVFATDLTERRARDLQLEEANKKIAEMKLMALRSVMSPHFVFNVLNSIQYFITTNDRLNAINYLSTFSKLIRSILNHSVDNKIKLADELDMLRNYVQLEMVRFENKFECRFDVAEDLDQDSLMLPSLMIQPYVENAILHGLYNKPGKGQLVIRVRESDDTLVFEIEDDGIGRVAAMKLREKNKKYHKSMGIKLTEERLKLINATQEAGVRIDDLYNDSGEACGTRVVLGIPL